MAIFLGLFIFCVLVLSLPWVVLAVVKYLEFVMHKMGEL